MDAERIRKAGNWLQLNTNVGRMVQQMKKKIGKLRYIDECAASCESEATMFAFGTNDYDKDRCENEKCECLCEKVASSYGTCKRQEHKGYRLYRYIDV